MLLAVELFSTLIVWDSRGKRVSLQCCINGVLATEPMGWLASQGPWMLQQWLIGIINFISNYLRKWISSIVRLISFGQIFYIVWNQSSFLRPDFQSFGEIKFRTLGESTPLRVVTFRIINSEPHDEVPNCEIESQDWLERIFLFSC